MTTKKIPLESIIGDLMYAAADYSDLDEEAIRRATSKILGEAARLAGFTQAEMSIVTDAEGMPPRPQDYENTTLHNTGFGSFGMSQMAADYFDHVKPTAISKLANSPAYVLGEAKPIHIFDDSAHVHKIEAANPQYFRPVPLDAVLADINTLSEKYPEEAERWRKSLLSDPSVLDNFYSGRRWCWEQRCPVVADFEGVESFSEFMSGLVMPVNREYDGEKQPMGFIVMAKPDRNHPMGFDPSTEPIPQERIDEIQRTVNLLGLPIQTVASALANKYLIGKVKTEQEARVAAEKRASTSRLVYALQHELNSHRGTIGSATRSLTDKMRATSSDVVDLESSIRRNSGELLVWDSPELFDHPSLWDAYDRLKQHAQDADLGPRLKPGEFKKYLASLPVEIPRTTASYLARLAPLGTPEHADVVTLLENEPKLAEGIGETLKRIGQTFETLGRIDRAQSHIGAYLSTLQGTTSQDYTQNVNLDTLLNSALTAAKEQREGSFIEFDKQYSLRPVADCVPVHLTQVYLNLIVNSIDAKASTVELDIQEKILGGKKHLVIDYRDNGTGIPDSIADKIMEPAFTTKEQGKGEGKGLWLVQDYMEHHGGSIQHVKEYTTGAHFRLTLPKYQRGDSQ